MSKGQYRGSEVAVKVLKPDPDLFAQFLQEASVTHNLRHANLVPLLGVRLHPLSLVLEFFPHGTLADVLCSIGPDPVQVQRRPPTPPPLSRRLLLGMLRDVAAGLVHLHSHSILHRDLRPPNIFVSRLEPSPLVKIGDFGLAVECRGSVRGILQAWSWMAPETLHEEAYDLRADVYSFGMLVWECFTRTAPFSEFYEDARFAADGYFDAAAVRHAIIELDLRPSLTPYVREFPPRTAELMQHCWLEPARRPPPTQLAALLAQELEEAA